MTSRVHLTEADQARARAVADAKERLCAALGWEDWPRGKPPDASLTGYLAELAVAQYLDVPWDPPIGTTDKHSGDVGGFQVRATKYRTGCLVVRPQDPPGHVYILVTGEPPDLAIVGWATGWEARRLGKWEARNGRDPAWWLHQSKLHPWPPWGKDGPP